MPSRRSSSPPPVMTWSKATPVLVVCAVFDALRLMFEMFWFFGPALAAALCTATVSGTVGTTIGGFACGAVAVAAGVAAATAAATFGVIMATATGFAGWLVVGLILVWTNQRIFKENAVWFAGSLLMGMTPLINALPAMTVIVWKMYSRQIKIEKAAYKKWEEEQAAAQLLERRQQGAANDAVYAQAANDAEYTQKLKNAA